MGKPEQLYRLGHKDCPGLYVAEQAGGWARWDKIGQAMKQTKAWWLANLTPGWEKLLFLEPVE